MWSHPSTHPPTHPAARRCTVPPVPIPLALLPPQILPTPKALGSSSRGESQPPTTSSVLMGLYTRAFGLLLLALLH